MDPRIENEYKTAKTKGFWISSYSVMEVAGSDRVSFLHRMLTQDIENLKENTCALSALLNAQGKVLFLFYVLVLESRILFLMDAENPSELIQCLDKFIVTDDVVLKDISFEWKVIQTRSDIELSLINRFHYGNRTFILVETGKLKPLKDILYKSGLLEYGSGMEETLRIEEGVPRYKKDVDASVTLPETGLDSIAASGTKGCYPGQEVVARTNTYKGHTKKLMRLEFEAGKSVKAGDKIYTEEKEIGWVSSATDIPGQNIGAGLGYILKGHFDRKQAIIQTSKEKITVFLKAK